MPASVHPEPVEGRTPRWTAPELALLRAHYPAEGIEVAARLPGRTWAAIHVKAHKLGLSTTHLAHAPRPKLSGPDLEVAIRLREEQHWSFARIGAKFGIAESSACNAVLIALCPRRGYTPAERDPKGRLTPAGRDRLRYALKKGLKGIDIQLRMGVSAACVAEQRRRYNRELKAAGKAVLPPPGHGEAYSGVKLSRAAKAQVEELFLTGLGTLKVSTRTGVSKTSCTRIRTRLIRRLRRQGQVLPGCDASGTRHLTMLSAAFVTPEQLRLLRAALRQGVPVLRAARTYAIGTSKAYQLRDQLQAELAARGEVLPAPIRAGRVPAGHFDQPHWPPQGPALLYAFRKLLQTLPFDQARDHWLEQQDSQRAADRQTVRAAEPAPLTFEQQLARVASGQVGLIQTAPRPFRDPTLTTPAWKDTHAQA